MARRGQLPLSGRPARGHDPDGWGERLPGRGRGGHAGTPRRPVGGGHRPPRRRPGQHRARHRRGGSATPSRKRICLSFVADRVARYKVPRSVEYTDQPLRNEAGKLRRSALRAERAALERLEATSPRQAAANAATKPTNASKSVPAVIEAEDVSAWACRLRLRPESVRAAKTRTTRSPLPRSARAPPRGPSPAAATRGAAAPPHTPRPRDRSGSRRERCAPPPSPASGGSGEVAMAFNGSRRRRARRQWPRSRRCRS